ncbi:MAG: EAL domain-containing protein [Deltaproteobacteria bacterium]|nr:EAL domain-containing protein [Deltaproteobacteria bacterium]
MRDLTRAEMKVAFQPIVDLDSGRTFAVEALARCQKKGLESPLVLFTQASAEKASGRLGRLIREVAFSEVSALPLFVNVHPDELAERWLVQPDDPLGFHDPPVFLEITEGAAFTHFELCSSVLMELCTRTGVHLVVDDFGAGYSNIQRILDLTPSVVKLDLALIRNIHQKPRQQAVVRHMVALCADLGCKVVAEGIETLDELLATRDLGVHYGQGYLLAKPAFVPPEVLWPRELARVAVGSPASKRSMNAPSSLARRVPTLPAGASPSSLSAGRVVVEEVVFVSRSDQLRPRVSPAADASKRTLGSAKPRVSKSKAPTVRPSERRSSRAPASAPTRRPPRKSKAPPR